MGREQDDADLLAVHHLTVLCYTIQHRLAFDTTVEAWAGAWGLLRQSGAHSVIWRYQRGYRHLQALLRARRPHIQQT